LFSKLLNLCQLLLILRYEIYEQGCDVMSLLRMSDLYAYIHTVLREDEVIRSLMGFTPSTTLEEMAQKIQKKRKPTSLVSENLPIISFYANPGLRGDNHLEYMVAFDFDIYVLDGDEETAINIADRINELFNEQYIGLKCVSSLKSEFMTMGEVETDQEDTYQFFTQILFTIAIEG